MRRVLIVLLGFGVFAGYGSAIASARWHHRQFDGGGCESRWSRGPGPDFRGDARQAFAPAPQAAPAPAVVATPALPAQQIFLIMPGAQGAAAVPQVITVPAPVAATP